MTLDEQKKYIQEQRSKGVADVQILQSLNQATTPAPQRSGAGELLPTAFSVGGGILGGMAGSVVPGAGTVAGGIAGAGLGGALGETIQQSIEKGFGVRDEYDQGQVLGTGVLDSALQATGVGVTKLFSKLAKPVFETSKPTFVKFVSKFSGYADDVLEQALKRTPGAIEGAKEGEKALVDVVKRTAAGLSKYAKETVAQSSKSIAEFTKQSVTGALPGTKMSLLQESSKYIPKVISSLRSDYNIGVDKAGQLIFDRAKNISNIVAGGDKSAIQDAFDAIRTISKNPDIAHIDSVLERLITLRSKTPVGSPTGPETRAIISKMSDSVVDFVKSVPPGFGKGYGKYATFLEENLPKRIMIQDAKELFGGSEHLSPKEVSQISMKLLQLYNTGKLEIRSFAGEVGDTIKEDIVGTAAGTLLKTGDQMSTRAMNLTRRGFIEKAVEYLPREVVQTYVKTGNVVGEFGHTVQTLANIAGVSTKAFMTEIGNLMSDKTTK